jgi:prepilin-type N-terminal cleavage/methylation domain-containing protein
MGGRRPRGFTLVELTVVMTVTTLLAVGLHQAYVRHGRFMAWQRQVSHAHDAFRVAGSLLSTDLREAVPSQGDIALLGPDSLSVRSPTGLGFACAVVEPSSVLGIDRVTGRMPEEPADSLLVYATSGWRAVGVVGQDRPGQRGISCGGQDPQVQLRLPNGGADDVPIGAPIRSFRRHVYHLVSNAGEPWLARTDAAGTQPLVGPLSPGGLTVRLLDADGLVESRLDLVEGVEVRMVMSGRATPGGLPASADTVVTVLQVRNR